MPPIMAHDLLLGETLGVIHRKHDFRHSDLLVELVASRSVIRHAPRSRPEVNGYGLPCGAPDALRTVGGQARDDTKSGESDGRSAAFPRTVVSDQRATVWPLPQVNPAPGRRMIQRVEMWS